MPHYVVYVGPRYVDTVTTFVYGFCLYVWLPHWIPRCQDSLPHSLVVTFTFPVTFCRIRYGYITFYIAGFPIHASYPVTLRAVTLLR